MSMEYVAIINQILEDKSVEQHYVGERPFLVEHKFEAQRFATEERARARAREIAEMLGFTFSTKAESVPVRGLSPVILQPGELVF